MIIAILALITLSLVVFILVGRQRETVWLAGIYAGFVLINIGLMLYYAKMGGLDNNEQFLFFIFPAFQNYLQDLPITLNAIAATTAVGQSLFLYFLMVFALEISGLMRRRWMFAVVAAWPAFDLLICNATFLARQEEDVRAVLLHISHYGMLAYLVLSIAFMLREYLSHSIGWVKRQLRYIILAIINIIVYYLIYCQLNPLYIVSQSIYPAPGFGLPLQYRLRLSFDMWMVSVAVMAAIYVVGVIALYKYTKIAIDAGKESLYMERQIDTAGMGVRVFIHGIKNQLLSAKILLDRLEARNPQASRADGELRNGLDELRKINTRMTSNIDTLYHSFKLKALAMVPHRAVDFARPLVEKYREKHPDIAFDLVVEADSLFMADGNYLGEAVENIMNNAVDAVRARWNGAEGGKITLTLKANSRWSAIRVDDNGVGMGRNKLSKIFRPFFTDKKTGSNWGIGLSSAQQIVKHHFGQIYADSTAGSGSFFVMALPRIFRE